MTPQEHSLLDDFLDRLQAAGPVAKDAEADRLIRSRLAGQPDAAYLLVQRCLLVQRALEEAQQQIDTLRRQQPAPAPGGSFLGGGGVPEGFGRAPSQAFAPHAAESQAAPAAAAPSGFRRWFGGGAQPQPPVQATPAMPPAAPGGTGPGFLGQAAMTAAGVAGGMFLFNGIEHLMGGAGQKEAAAAANPLADSGGDAGSLGSQMTEHVSADPGSAGGSQGLLDDRFDDPAGGGDWSDNVAGDYPDDGDSFI